MKSWFYQYRVLCVALSVLLGLGIAITFHKNAFFFLSFIDVTVGDRLQASLFLVLLSLPTLFVLWLYKTRDVRQQLEKTTEQINLSMFHHATNLITDATSDRRLVGLQQLLEMSRANSNFTERVALITGNSLDLSKTNLRGADLTGANLTGANLIKADLTGANLERANLTGATLKGAYLTGANLTGATLKGAYLTGANLERANLTDANRERAYIEGANLKGAYLEGANLKGAKLRGATFDKSQLSEKQLEEAIFEASADELIIEGTKTI